MCESPIARLVTRERVQRAAAIGAVTGSQPSTGVVFPSSHTSPASTLPSPQRAAWHTPAEQTPAQVKSVVVTRSGPQVRRRSTTVASQNTKPFACPEHPLMIGLHVPSL